MDTTTQLALMTKAKKVFGNDKTFLSFPVTPLTFSKETLDFVSDMDYDDLKAFSLLVNSIPDGEAWLPTSDRALWDIYDDVLNGVETEVAWSARTDREEEQYQAASQLLQTTAGEDTEAYKRYKQYRDQLFVLQERYAAAKSTGETTADPVLKNHWLTVEKPQLRQAIQNLETEWITDGYKHEVEQAQGIKARLGAKSPSLTWQDWRSHFNQDIDQITGTDNVQFFPSSFSPMNAIDEGAWQTFTLTADEIPKMLEQAPAKLKQRLAADLQDSDITSITFEFSSAAVLRPWLDADVFAAKFWRFLDQHKKLSDGQSPPVGVCPAYTTAVVFARNIVVEKQVSTSKPPSNSKPGKTGNSLQFSTAMQALQVQPMVKLQPQYTTLKQNPLLNPQLAHKVKVTAPAGNSNPKSAQPRSRQVQPSARSVHLAAATTVRMSPRQTQSLQAVTGTKQTFQATPKVFTAQSANWRVSPTVQPVSTVKMKPNPSNAAQLSDAFLRLQKAAIVRPILPVTPVQPRPSKPTPQGTKTVQERLTQADEVCILAFICKLLPACPDPDPTLQW
ncbi:MAG: hypothetical protein F6K00_11285 [Leptolyngbya sp. SIOISBB]|nr:hypothetical protein [Leptolyngbya sp. SIOISBB]